MKRGKAHHRLDYHVIFGTSHREKILDMDMFEKIRFHSSEKADELDFIIHIINGYYDHVHMLLSIPPKYAIADIVKHIKGYTSRSIPELKWQTGYGVFTVDGSSFDRVFRYIKNQWAHHSKAGIIEDMETV